MTNKNNNQKRSKQKLYCYVDESGQDTKSEIFVVVAIVNDKNQDAVRCKLLQLEKQTKIRAMKWHKTPHNVRYQFLEQQIERKILNGDIFFGRFPKPIPYFLPLLEVIEKAIKSKARTNYSCNVYIDSIDIKKSKELTNALRVKHINMPLIKSRRDESEPIIRLADRWAGYIRGLQFDKKQNENLFKKAIRLKCIQEVK